MIPRGHPLRNVDGDHDVEDGRPDGGGGGPGRRRGRRRATVGRGAGRPAVGDRLGGVGLDDGRTTRGRTGVVPVAARSMRWCAEAHPEPPVAAWGFGTRVGRGVGVTWRPPAVGMAALPGLDADPLPWLPDVPDPPDSYWVVGGCVSSVVA